MFCVIQEIERKKPARPGGYKELKAYPMEMSFNGVRQKTKYCYEYTGERFERPIRTAYRVSIHESKRVHGVVTKKQYAVTTVGFYELAEYWIGDCILSNKLEAIAASLNTSTDTLWEIIGAKVDPLEARIKAEYQQTDEYKTKMKHEKILKAYRAKKEAFAKRYGVDEYEYCYNVFGEVMNQAYLDEITQAAEYRQRSYYESSNSNYSYSFNSFTNPTYTSEEKERLKRFYKSLSKLYHPDVNHDPNAHGDMVLLNRLKEEWEV